jgi:hypothetical protein
VKVYKVVVVRDGGLRDVLAEFTSRERAERFAEQVREIDREAKLEIVEETVEVEREALSPIRAILAMLVLIIGCTLLLQMAQTLSLGGRRVV